jgi:hypothetical protein
MVISAAATPVVANRRPRQERKRIFTERILSNISKIGAKGEDFPGKKAGRSPGAFPLCPS